ncbi:amidase [Actinomycetospora corticicola]|uniref:Aspartyl-tRNA(Asn)/glutamyl-tRNA(Gln) amidotransferase subunit A n=1 Tax=Actinomycetospora corticicola TaxID=663602 RepID=A0A7Y9J441_9PSEU|nr:amidase [Actinomycetospora corticicola]NYD34657.1 aspartyl-tRNA(Asn)/glutamyl-tRNA(Gln) amidotransferase subunit A [Actinomycetospora corticicola]
MSFPTSDALRDQAARLGFTLDDDLAEAMHTAVTGAEPAIAALRDRPRALDLDADPADGDRWVRRDRTAPAVGNLPDDEEGIGGLLAAYAAGERTPEDEVARSLADLRATHEALNCTIRFLDDRATAAAAESARRWRDGTARPLEGVPFGVKDVIDVAGVPTTAGSWCHGDTPAAASAEVVRRLEAAGAIPVSKDATTEFAVGGPHPPRFGPTRNPWNRDRWAGGSSTGSAAAVAAGAVPFALGTDVGGSVRLPSAWTGLTGLKPTAGAISRVGVVPLSWTAETVGPIARSAADVARVFDVLAGTDDRDPRSWRPEPPIGVLDRSVGNAPTDVRGLRIAVPGGALTELCDAEVRAGVDALVAELVDAGAEVVPAEIPGAAAALAIGYLLVFTEAATLHRVDRDRWGDYDPVVVRRISQGITTPAQDYLRAQQFRVELQRELDAVFAVADLVVVPTCPSTAPRLDGTVVVDGVEYPLYAAQSRSTMLGNLTGVPGLAVPTGVAADGCPISAQLIARPHAEATALRAAHVFQSRTGHHRRRPVDVTRKTSSR